MQLVKLLFLLVRRLNHRSNKIDDILPGADFPHPDFFPFLIGSERKKDCGISSEGDNKISDKNSQLRIFFSGEKCVTLS